MLNVTVGILKPQRNLQNKIIKKNFSYKEESLNASIS
jgi:hypothetical protein